MGSSGIQWDLVGSRRDRRIEWDLRGIQWDPLGSGGIRWDPSVIRRDLSGNIWWDLSGIWWDLVGSEWDLGGIQWDLVGSGGI